MTNDEKDLEFLREVKDNYQLYCHEATRTRLLTIAVNALAGKDRAEYADSHIVNGMGIWTRCAVCGPKIVFDPRHLWLELDWQKAKWKELER